MIFHIYLTSKKEKKSQKLLVGIFFIKCLVKIVMVRLFLHQIPTLNVYKK